MSPIRVLPKKGDWWKLPSGSIVSIRQLTGPEDRQEARVRYVDEHGGMSQGEFDLRADLIARGEKVVSNG